MLFAADAGATRVGHSFVTYQRNMELFIDINTSMRKSLDSDIHSITFLSVALAAPLPKYSALSSVGHSANICYLTFDWPSYLIEATPRVNERMRHHRMDIIAFEGS